MIQLRHAIVIYLLAYFVLSRENPMICPHLCNCEIDGFVNCSQRGLSEIPPELPPTTVQLDLSQNQITFVTSSAFGNLVRLTSIDISSNNLGNDQIQDGAFDLPLLESIDLSYSNFTDFPGNLFPKSLKKLIMVNSHVTSIPPASLKHTTSLETLDLSGNNIAIIPSGVLDNLPMLKTLDLSFNQLTNNGMPQNIFKLNLVLTALILRSNKLSHVLETLPDSLRHLDYVGNVIQNIPSYAFKTLSNLQILELWQGEITTLEDNAFYGLDKLEFLFMTQDRVNSTITNTTFEGLYNLKKLYLDFNNISIIDQLAFSTLKNIESIYLTNNTLSKLEPEVLDPTQLRHLSNIDLSGNPWYCDCHLRWLKEATEQAPYTITNPQLMTCIGPSTLVGQSFNNLKSSDFVCNEM